MKSTESRLRFLPGGSILLAFGMLLFIADIYSLFHYTINASMLICCLSSIAYMLVYGVVKESCSNTVRISIFALLKAVAWMLLVSIGLGSLLEFLTVLGLSGSPFDGILLWSRKRLLVFSLLAFFFLLFLVYVRSHQNGLSSKAAMAALGGRKGVVFLGVAVFSALLSAVLLALVLGGTYLAPYRRFLLPLELFLSALLIVFTMRHLGKRVEFLFLSLAITLGTYLSFALPPITNLAPDDQIHYERALGLSFFGHGEVSGIDGELVDVPWGRGGVLDHELIDGICKRMEEAGSASNAVSSKREVTGFVTPFSGESYLFVSIVGAAPSAVGLWMGRLMHLSSMGTFILGRWFNLLCYVLVVFIAVGITPTRKVLFSVVGLLPTALFLASGYSYDPWLLSLSMLGIALFVRLHRSSSVGSLTVASFIPCFISLSLAIMVKAVYFPLLGLLFLMPKRCFASSGEARRCRGAVLGLVLLLVASFILPMLFSSAAQAGDVRGGADVNALGQVIYITRHPLEYMKTLLCFILGYISPIASNGYSVYYAYIGSDISAFPLSVVSTVPLIILLASAQTAFGDEAAFSFSFWSKCWISLLVILTIALSATALYISFTGVGNEEIAGMQPRYLLPLLIPSLMMVRARGTGEWALPSLRESRVHVMMLPGTMMAIVLISVLLDIAWVVSW